MQLEERAQKMEKEVAKINAKKNFKTAAYILRPRRPFVQEIGAIMIPQRGMRILCRLTRVRPEDGRVARHTLSAIGLVAAVSILVGCNFNINQFREQEELLAPLLQQHAHISSVTGVLGTNYIWYEKGGTNWNALMNVLNREPPTRMKQVREYTSIWPAAMLYSTPEMMTWVFLDTNKNVQAFIVGAQ